MFELAPAGAVVDDERHDMPRDSIDFTPIPLTRSPSGLFTRRRWERDRVAAPEWAPRSASPEEEEFALWVHAEAKALAAELDRLAEQGPPAALTKNLRAVAESLWADAEWARRQVDGSFSEAA